jgi:hypothetical protein
MQPPPSEEELEEAKQAMLSAIRDGRVTIAGMPEDQQDTFDFMKDKK